MADYEPMVVTGPDGQSYRIPKAAKDDWDSWIELTGGAWTPPLYAKLDSAPTGIVRT